MAEYIMDITVTEVSGWHNAICGLRISHNSIEKSDSVLKWGDNLASFKLGPKDQALMGGLITESAQNHSDSFSKFLRAINVSMTIKAPMYWWSEFDTYKIGVTRMSSSLMHRHLGKDFTENDFEYIDEWWLETLNGMREVYAYSRQHDRPEVANGKLARLRAMIPSGYLYTSYVNTNYQTLLHMCNDRASHKLPHWKKFVEALMISLPYFEGFYISMNGGKGETNHVEEN